MKALKFLIIAVAVLGACLQAIAQSNLPIYSSSALRAYALSQARKAYVQAASNTGDTAGFQDYYWDAPKSSTEILSLINATGLSFDTTDTSATAYLYVTVTDKDGWTLFQGYSSGKPVQESGKWTLPASMGTISIELADEVRIPLSKAVSSAYVIDAQGYYYYIPSSDGALLFPKASAGLSGGKLKVYYQDGTVETFLIPTGEVIPTMAVSATVNAGIKDVLTFKDPATVTVSVLATNRKGVLPTIEVVKSTAGNVPFDIATSDGKRPTTLWYRLSTSDEWQSIAVGSSWPFSISLSAGVTYVVPEFNVTDFSEETAALDYGGGGKG